MAAAVVGLVAGAAGCRAETPPQPSAGGATGRADTPPAPRQELVEGERLYDANCARCHGARGVGTDHGPPFVHVIYQPSHHSDAAFQAAAAQGVRAHHWSFGDMPAVPGVTPDQVSRIVEYVRWLQRQGGIV